MPSCERFDAARARFERAAAELARSNGAIDERMLDDEEAVIITEQSVQPSKLNTRVRFPSPAPIFSMVWAVKKFHSDKPRFLILTNVHFLFACLACLARRLMRFICASCLASSSSWK